MKTKLDQIMLPVFEVKPFHVSLLWCILCFNDNLKNGHFMCMTLKMKMYFI